MNIKRVRGFTLIELMIVVAVIAILAAITLPAYNEQVRKSRRSEATSGIQQLVLQQERWRANNASYGTLDQIGTGAVASSYYTFAMAGNPTATSYSITATPTGVQTSDTKCGTFTYRYDGTAVLPALPIERLPTTSGCWN